MDESLDPIAYQIDITPTEIQGVRKLAVSPVPAKFEDMFEKRYAIYYPQFGTLPNTSYARNLAESVAAIITAACDTSFPPSSTYASKIKAYRTNDAIAGYTNSIEHIYGNESIQRKISEVLDQILILDDLTDKGLLSTAREIARKNWSPETVANIIRSRFYRFNDLRAWVKTKLPKAKLTSYASIECVPGLCDVISPDLDDITLQIISHSFKNKIVRANADDLCGIIKSNRPIAHIKLSTEEKTMLTLGYIGKEFVVYPIEYEHPASSPTEDTCKKVAEFVGAPYVPGSISMRVKPEAIRIKNLHVSEDKCVRRRLEFITNTSKPFASYGLDCKIRSKPKVMVTAVDIYQLHKKPVEWLKSILYLANRSSSGSKDELQLAVSKYWSEVYIQEEPTFKSYFKSNYNQLIRVNSKYREDTCMARIKLSGEHVLFDANSDPKYVPLVSDLLLYVFIWTHLRHNCILDLDYVNTMYPIDLLIKSMFDTPSNYPHILLMEAAPLSVGISAE